jgi:nucleoside-diphosphate-sugar epimerase
MTTLSSPARPILVTGAAGAIGSIGRNVTEMLLAKGHRVRALVRQMLRRTQDVDARPLAGKGTALDFAGLPVQVLVRRSA